MGTFCPFVAQLLMDTPSVQYTKQEVTMREQTRLQLHAVIKWFRGNIGLLVSLWILGLVLGAFFAPAPDDPYFSLMRPEIKHRVSIVFGLMTAILPLMLAAYAVCIQNQKLLLFVSFCKAFLFSFCGCLIGSLFGSAGLLMRLLLQFTELISAPVFCWFCIRQLSGDNGLQTKDLVISLLVTLAAAGIDYFLLGPYFAMLIDI